MGVFVGLLSGHAIDMSSYSKVIWKQSGEFAAFLVFVSPEFLTLPIMYRNLGEYLGPRPNRSDPQALQWFSLSALNSQSRSAIQTQLASVFPWVAVLLIQSDHQLWD